MRASMIDDALFEKAYQAFISANDGGKRRRLEAALAVIAPRLNAADGLRRTAYQLFRYGGHENRQNTLKAIKAYDAAMQPAQQEEPCRNS
jgi:hypothetical protein